MSIDPKTFIEQVSNREAPIAVVGLGYVGLPLAVAFGKKFRVVGFDIAPERVALLREGKDPSDELTAEELAQASIEYTSDPAELERCPFIVVAVPTPIDRNKNPDLEPLVRASETIGGRVRRGTIVVFESTVYPGVTEEVCGPLIERGSGLRCGQDFFLGYSPERINPGDREHTIERITKVVSGQTPEVLRVISGVYGAVVPAGIHEAPTIRVAEAAKVIENAQRDINIAFVNELSIIFDKLGIDTKAVLEAAGTKWNFLNFRPGLVGGHCIGVDPYYLTFRAQAAGHTPQTILSGRRINDGMGRWIARKMVKMLIECDKKVNNARVLICGLTFKENVTDTRNSRVKDIIDELLEFKVRVFAHDPHVPASECVKHFGVPAVDRSEMRDFDGIIFAVPHDEFRGYSAEEVGDFVGSQPAPFFDIRWQFDPEELERVGFRYWRL